MVSRPQRRPRLALAMALAGAGCGDDAQELRPVIDTPSADQPAAVLPDADELRLAVYVEGDLEPVVAGTFRRGEPVVLPGAPVGERLLIDLSARLGGTEIGFGRTCGFDLARATSATGPHLFIARPRVWSSVPEPLAHARAGATGLTYHDGSGMLVGGTDGAGAVTAIERFDPMTGALTDLATVAPRLGAAVAMLGDGRVAILGGLDADSGQPATYLELIEADAAPERRVERVGTEALARHQLTATALVSGGILAVGGRDGAGQVSGDLAVLRTDGGATRVVVSADQLTTPRSGHSATRLGNDPGAPVLIVGGVDGTGQPIASAELYVPARDALADPAAFAPRLVVPRTGHRAVRLGDGSVLILGGVDGAGAPVTALELFSFDRGFVAGGALPVEAGVVELSVTELPDGRALIAGGRDAVGGSPRATTFVVGIDPEDGTLYLAPSTPMRQARAGHAAAMLCDGTVILGGGTTAPSPLERYRLDRAR